MTSNFVMTPQKYPEYLHTKKILLFFLKTPKDIEIQHFEPSLRMYKNIRIPPPWGSNPLPTTCF